MASLAKISRPRLPAIVPRVRLFARLDAAPAAIWIAGPPGAGKTTLAASYVAARMRRCLWFQLDSGDADPATFFYYLAQASRRAAPGFRRPLPLFTAQYHGGLQTFARRFFRELWGRLDVPFAVVLDGLHEVPPGCELPDLLCEALVELPEGARTLLLAREAPPPALARLRANGALEVIDAEDLQLASDEVAALARLRGAAEEDGRIEGIRARTKGWAAGVVLMLAGRSRGNGRGTAETPSAVFDYFAGEVFDRADAVTRQVLLEAALLPNIPASSAESLTGVAAATDILADLARRGYFTSRSDDAEPTYAFHPLFREFLLARGASALTPERRRRVRVRAAALLDARGLVDDAVGLLSASEDALELADLVVRHAPELFRTGRGRTLASWIGRIPEPVRERRPWLLFWQGLSAMEGDVSAARAHLERAYAAFVEAADATGQYRAWAAVLEAYFFEWHDFAPLDRWIAEFDELRRRHPEFPDDATAELVSIAFAEALMYRQPASPARARSMDHVREVALESSDPAVRARAARVLVLQDQWWGEQGRDAVIAVVRADLLNPGVEPFTRIIGLALVGLNAWLAARPTDALAALDGALGLSRETGVHVWDFMIHAVAASAACAAGDLALAERHAAAMRASSVPGRRMSACIFRHVAAAIALRRSDGRGAREHGEVAIMLAERAGVPLYQCSGRIIAGVGWMLDGALERARARLGEAERLARELESPFLELCCLVPRAVWALREGDAHGPELVTRALACARAHGTVTEPWVSPEILAELCAAAIERGLDPDEARVLVRSGALPAPQGVELLEGWPWPVRVRTLGAFEVALHGEPVRFRSKVQRRPLDLLKALVALGGHQVSEGRLAEALWPDADGDSGVHALQTTLYRLRRLVGADVVTAQERALTLDPKRCFVDALVVVRLVERASGRLERGALDEALALTERAVALYRGSFLPGDDVLPCVITARGQLRRRLERHLGALRARVAGDSRAESLTRGVSACDPGFGGARPA
ncbi:BTAD domain-containing putative transcriptional regulator [Anaeromyxobacter terrae]|uniref:BTAD domain-containing putative transcriptional regulator n=1 Tax=Anaeromyxobacter terrae TaxID=2925406 RepID=UPI001F55D9C3|nr:hypothetical protein [Anaeromyxobacter sp. SG22]